MAAAAFILIAGTEQFLVLLVGVRGGFSGYQLSMLDSENKATC